MRQFYRMMKYVNDAKAISNRRIFRRVGRRGYGKVTGHIARWLFG